MNEKQKKKKKDSKRRLNLFFCLVSSLFTPDRVVDEETVGLEIKVYRKMKLKKEEKDGKIEGFCTKPSRRCGGIGKGCWMGRISKRRR